MPATQNNSLGATDNVKRRRVDESRGVKSFMPDLFDAEPTHHKIHSKNDKWVRTLACTSDHICSGSTATEVNLWKCTKSEFKLERTLDGHDFGVCSLDMADNVEEKGDKTGLLVAATMTGEMKIWDIRQHKCSHTIEASTGDVSQVRFLKTGHGHVLISGGPFGDLVKWDFRSTGKELARIRLGYGPVQSIAVSDYGYAACGMETGVLPIVNLVEDKIIGSPPYNHRLAIRAVAFSRDARRIVTASNDGHVSVINPKHVKDKKDQALAPCYEQHFSAHASWVTGVAFHPSGGDLVTVSRDKAIRAWSVSTKEGRRNGDLKRQWAKSAEIMSIAYATNGEFFATGDAAHTVSVYRQKDPPEANGADPP